MSIRRAVLLALVSALFPGVLLAQASYTVVNASSTFGSSVSTTSNTSLASECLILTRTLRNGNSGNDVSRLQIFLALDPAIYPEGKVTGYFGLLTEAALKRWQTRVGIVSSGTPSTTGYGVAGPRTRAALAAACNAASASADNVGAYMKVTPASGQAPLPVTFEIFANTGKSCAAQEYKLDFGDASAVVTMSVDSSCSQIERIFSHSYARGTYTATLSAGDHNSSTEIVAY